MQNKPPLQRVGRFPLFPTNPPPRLSNPRDPGPKPLQMQKPVSTLLTRPVQTTRYDRGARPSNRGPQK